MVPRPSQLQCVKPIPTLGDELCDALEFQRPVVEEEQNRLDDVHDNENIPCRREVILDLDDLKGKRVAVIWNDIAEDDDQDAVHTWYFGLVTSIARRKRRGGTVVKCTAAIDWETCRRKQDAAGAQRGHVCGAWQHT